nr:HXXEE domain-containing protein [Paenibacillus caui]
MDNIQLLIWFLPVLFMVHDFEEIIMVEAWKKRNSEWMQNPKAPFHSIQSAASASIAVAEEFVILCIATILSQYYSNYNFWVGLFVAFSVHLVVHIIWSIQYKKYVPGLITSVIFTPLCAILIVKAWHILNPDWVHVSLFSLLSIVIMIVNLYILHKLMSVFHQWLIRYSKKMIY